MEDAINNVLSSIGGVLFGPVMLCVYFGVGLMFTVLLKGVQFLRFGAALVNPAGHRSPKIVCVPLRPLLLPELRQIPYACLCWARLP